jgi:hypothetical protein
MFVWLFLTVDLGVALLESRRPLCKERVQALPSGRGYRATVTGTITCRKLLCLVFSLSSSTLGLQYWTLQRVRGHDVLCCPITIFSLALRLRTNCLASAVFTHSLPNCLGKITCSWKIMFTCIQEILLLF